MKEKSTLKSRANNYLAHTKKQKGITLIALVVTIVILLILAGITINAVMGEDGLINRAKVAANKTEEGVQNDIEIMENLSDQLDEILTEQSATVSNLDIGKAVDYIAKNETIAGGIDLTWRIFYVDATYVYLISEKAANTRNPVACFDLRDYRSGYSGSADIEDATLRGLNQMWFNQLNGTASTTESAKSVAYLMDQTVWDGYKDNEGKATYAIGSPTIELFANSFNATAQGNGTENRIIPTCTNNDGYLQNTEDDWLLTEYNNGIYNGGYYSGPDPNICWIASPCLETSGSNNSFYMYIVQSYNKKLTPGGYGSNFGYNYNNGARPVVLIPKSNFTFTIIDEE